MQRLHLYFLLIIISLSLSSTAQDPNSWIKPNQQYVAFKVSKTGVYRIDRDQLVNTLNAFSTVNPKNIQVFARGEEQYIYIKGENDYSFDSGDYIELYCKKNDGALDTAMYEKPVFQNNPYYSQINDSISYFITWENTPNPKKRYSTIQSDNYNTYPEYSNIKVKDIYSYTSTFYWGRRVPIYSSGKGWFDNKHFFKNAPVSKTFSIPQRKSNSNLKVEYSICGIPNSQVFSDVAHTTKISFRNNYYTKDLYEGYEGVKNSFTIRADSILNNNITLKFNAFGEDNLTPDINVVSYINLEYEHNQTLSPNQTFKFFTPSLNETSFIHFKNYQGNNPILYNEESGKRIIGVTNGSDLFFTLPHSEHQHYILSSESLIASLEPKHLQKVKFKDFSNLAEEPDYLLIYHNQLKESAIRYAEERRSKGHKVLTADINQLYNQFAYGVNKHPLAIRYFVKYIDEHYPSTNKKLFLVGKGYPSATTRKKRDVFKQCLIPPMGNPPSDVAICSNIDSTGFSSYASVGRLSARNNEDVDIYLNKVKDYESHSALEIWRKRALHLGGGKTSYEQSSFKNYLQEYKRIYEDTVIAGTVTSFFKENSEPIQISSSDSVENLLNSGISLMTFFGHGSANGFDKNIDRPVKYNNRGKYPLIMANSCLSGNIYSSNNSISEEWVLIENKGAIAFLAASDLGYTSELHKLSKELYQNIAYKKYGACLGDIINNSYLNYVQRSTHKVQKNVYDNTLHGDPSIILNYYEKADLAINKTDVKLIPEIVSTSLDSFEVEISFHNWAKAVNDTFFVSVQRTLPNGKTNTYQILNTQCLFTQKNIIKLPCLAEQSVGINKLFIRLDYYSQIEEISKQNNTCEVNFLVRSTNLLPLYPYNFSVVGESKQSLIASSGDPFIEDFDAVFEIDTNDSFSSPFLRKQTIPTSGGITSWELPFDLQDSTVYFWRVSRLGSNLWKEQSFRYIKNQQGWSQAHFHQFKDDKFKFINYVKPQQKFEFTFTPKKLLCKNKGSVSVGNLNQVGFWIDDLGDDNSCSTLPAFNVVVIDPVNLEVWKSNRQNFGHRDFPKCPSRFRADLYFQFTTTNETQMNSMADMLDQIPDNYYILIYSVWNGNFKQVPEKLKLAIEKLYPASDFRNIDDNIPYILLTQKGNISFSEERIGNSSIDAISLEKNLRSNFYKGYITSPKIGPALKWNAFYWDYKEKKSKKKALVKMTAFKRDKTERIIFDGIDKDSLAILNLENYVDARTYPYLQLEFFTEDDLYRTPAQLESWSLLYTQVPETAIDPKVRFYMNKDTLNQGEDLMFSISTRNISDVNMDSLQVHFFIKDSLNQITSIKQGKLRPHPAGDVLTDSIIYNTINTQGQNSIWVEFNGFNEEKGGYDQNEQYHFNNIATRYFYVKPDIVNPLLNVTFDGRRIMNGDIVSAKPNILIELKDDNHYLALDNPDFLSVYLKKQGSEQEIKIMEMDSTMHQQLFWTPAELPNNKASLLFTPHHLEDGIYTLRVTGVDASNNASGKYDYQVNFEVINKSTISEVLNYPNPFSTSTQFIFTLTGSTIPDEVIIQIFTVSGRVVKEIELNELTNLRIGTNITDYHWDGKDEYGDNLANGVYFYKVLVKKDGKKIEYRKTNTSKYFKKNIGKMYILR